MHRDDKKRRKASWKAQQRATARAALPLSEADMRGMFLAVDEELRTNACDRSRRFTLQWLGRRAVDTDAVLRWLDEHGGFCDCEVLANAAQAFEAAVGWELKLP